MKGKRIVVIGLGNFGASAALALAEMGHRVSAVDLDEERVDEVADRLDLAVGADGTDPAVLERVRARGADVAIVSTGEDVTASVLAAIALRDLAVGEIHVKVISDLHARILDRVGLFQTVFPERESALGVAHRVADRSILNYVRLGEGLSAQEMTLPDRWVGRSLRELELPRRYRVAVIAVHDYLSGEANAIPDPDAPLKESDALLVAGRDQDLEKLARIG